MKHIVLFLSLILINVFSHSIDLSLHGDANSTNISYDLGIDIVTEENNVYFTTGLYRDQTKRYSQIFEVEGVYMGLGKHFMLNEKLSVAANAKFYEKNNFQQPVYCLRITQILNFF